MIIMLRGANFAANNIGKITIDREVSVDTANILSKYSRVLTKEQQLAFDDFMYSIKSNGLYDKMSMLLIPTLAGNVTESFYDIKTGVNRKPGDASAYAVSNKGLYISGEGTTDLPSRYYVALPSTLSIKNLHIASYLTNGVYSGSPSNHIGGLADDPYIVFGTSLIQLGASANLKALSDSNTLNSIGLRVVSCNGDNKENIILNYCGLPQVSQEETGDFATLPNYNFSKICIDLYDMVAGFYSPQTPTGVFSIGTAMSAEDMALYSVLSKNLMDILAV